MAASLSAQSWSLAGRGSHQLLDAGTLEAARTSLLLHLAGRPVTGPASASAAVARGRRQLHVLLVDAWCMLGGGE